MATKAKTQRRQTSSLAADTPESTTRRSSKTVQARKTVSPKPKKVSPVTKPASTTRPPKAAKSAAKPRRESRELLLEATSRILSQRSSIDVSLSEIAQESGLNSALISYHFGNKEGLLVALVARDSEASMARLGQLLDMDIPPEEKIRRHIFGVITHYVRHPYLNHLVHHLLDTGSAKVARKISDLIILPVRDAHRRMIAEGVAAGVFRSIDPMHFYFTFIGACDIIFRGRASLEHGFGLKDLSRAARENYADFVAEVALRALRPE